MHDIVTELMKDMVALYDGDDLYKVLAVIAISDELLVTESKTGEIRLFEIDDIKDQTCQLFRNQAAAEAYLKAQEQDEAEAA